jgi:hypothetical protein
MSVSGAQEIMDAQRVAPIDTKLDQKIMDAQRVAQPDHESMDAQGVAPIDIKLDQEIMDAQRVALIDAKMNDEIKYLLATNKTVERTDRMLEELRRKHNKRERSRSPNSRSRSPESKRGRALPSAYASFNAYVQQLPSMSRTTRFAILCSERSVFNARVQKEALGK